MTIELSEEIEKSLQAYLAQQGLEADAMSNVVEEAVETFLFRQMFKEAHERNAGVDPEKAQADIEGAVDDYRSHQNRS